MTNSKLILHTYNFQTEKHSWSNFQKKVFSNIYYIVTVDVALLSIVTTEYLVAAQG